MVTYTSYADII